MARQYLETNKTLGGKAQGRYTCPGPTPQVQLKQSGLKPLFLCISLLQPREEAGHHFPGLPGATGPGEHNRSTELYDAKGLGLPLSMATFMARCLGPSSWHRVAGGGERGNKGAHWLLLQVTGSSKLIQRKGHLSNELTRSLPGRRVLSRPPASGPVWASG